MYTFFKHNLNTLLTQQGFKDTNDFLNVTFHIKDSKFVIATTSILTAVSAFFERMLGIEIVVTLVIFILFALEMYTGIKASKIEGKIFDSNKFPRGWVKLAVYIIFIGCANMLAVHMKPKPIFGFEVNIYELFHYALINFTVVNFLISNIENFERLGWDEYIPLISVLSDFMNKFKKKKE